MCSDPKYPQLLMLTIRQEFKPCGVKRIPFTGRSSRPLERRPVVQLSSTLVSTCVASRLFAVSRIAIAVSCGLSWISWSLKLMYWTRKISPRLRKELTGGRNSHLIRDNSFKTDFGIEQKSCGRVTALTCNSLDSLRLRFSCFASLFPASKLFLQTSSCRRELRVRAAVGRGGDIMTTSRLVTPHETQPVRSVTVIRVTGPLFFGYATNIVCKLKPASRWCLRLKNPCGLFGRARPTCGSLE